MHIHILGIGGTFMGGVAAIARAAGHRVTGCDTNVYPPMSTQLAALGIEALEGYTPDQVKLKPDAFVIGNVVTRGNPLMEEILDQGAPYISGPQWFAENVLHGKWVVAVAGTHGKTTTASMLAWILEAANLMPGFLIGGVPENFGVSARLSTRPSQPFPAKEGGVALPFPLEAGEGGFFVIEADEYDTAFFDKRSKFVHYRPRTAVLNNLEFDHADIFPDLGAIETQFHHFVRTVPGNGRIVSNGADANLERVLGRGCWTPVERFGVASEWHAGVPGADGAFDVLWRGAAQGRVRWDLQGTHNRLNALAAIAGARHVGVPPQLAIEALGTFRNVKRRMEVKGTVNGITIYDDFAHHPTAIEVTLAGLRAKVNGARIVAVLEPRSNTMKLGVMKEQLAASLADADRVYCYSASLTWDAVAVLAPLGEKAHVCSNFDRLLGELAASVRSGDHVLIMSNGGFGGIHEKLLAALAAR
jgi:UDP-N-acetylmuramate: L-alanyl-gamma-D-glutamyl-meso-diaminopimelate ligase